MLLEKIEALLKEVSTLTASNAEEIEQLRLKYLSRKGEINALMQDFRNVAAEDKKTVGMKINELKQLAFDHINALKEQLENGAEEADDLDLTRTPYPIQLGTRHPLTIVKNEIIDIFQRMGFTPTILPATCRTPSSSRPVPTMWRRTSSSARTPRTTRHTIWRRTSHPSALSARAASTATRPSRLAPIASSIRWKASTSTRTFRSPT